jgi:hypothetical protein
LYFPFLAYFPYFEKIEEAYEITLLYVCALPPNAAKQRLGTHVSMSMNTRAKLEELFDAVSSVLSVPYQIVPT